MAKPFPSDISDDVKARFWSRVDRRGDDDCWLWTGSKSVDGYGSISANGRVLRATHLALFLENGIAPAPGMCACHKCDNPPCVNPRHLFIGTIHENNTDRHRKGRTVFRPIPAEVKARGEAHGSARLTNEQVVAIMDSDKSIRQLAAEFGVGFGTVQRIKKGTAWGHLRAALAARGLEVREKQSDYDSLPKCIRDGEFTAARKDHP